MFLPDFSDTQILLFLLVAPVLALAGVWTIMSVLSYLERRNDDP